MDRELKIILQANPQKYIALFALVIIIVNHNNSVNPKT